MRSLSVSRFKSIDAATLQFGHLTLLVGTNASGKSNLLEALQLLAWVARGQRLGDLPSALRDGQLAVRGGVSDLLPLGAPPAPVGFEVRLDGPGDMGCLRLQLELHIAQGEVSIGAELLEAPEYARAKLPLYRTVGAPDPSARRLRVEYNNFKRGGKKPTVDCVDDRPVFTQLISPARFERHHDEAQAQIPSAAEATQAALRGVLFLDPDPRAMRGYAFREEQLLRGD
ncbi:MAG: AAA family ATPase, partial [bacterium]